MGGVGFESSKFLAVEGSKINIYGEKALKKLGNESRLSAQKQRDIEKFACESCNIENYLEKGHLDGVINVKDIHSEINEFLEECLDKDIERYEPKKNFMYLKFLFNAILKFQWPCELPNTECKHQLAILQYGCQRILF